MKPGFKVGQQVFFLISGRLLKEAVIVAVSSGFVTIRFRKKEECIIRLPYGRIFPTKEEALQHIRPALPPQHLPMSRQGKFGYDYTCRRGLWE